MLYKTSLNRFVVIHSLLVWCLVNYNKLMNNNNIKNVYLIFNLSLFHIMVSRDMQSKSKRTFGIKDTNISGPGRQRQCAYSKGYIEKSHKL